METAPLSGVIPGLVPGTHATLVPPSTTARAVRAEKEWVPGTRPGMTTEGSMTTGGPLSIEEKGGGGETHPSLESSQALLFSPETSLTGVRGDS
jgi:hypothetical protein